MKKLTKTGVSLMVLSAFVLAPIISYAQLNTNLTGDVTADIDSAIDANVDASTNVDTSVGTDSGVNSNTDVNTGVEIYLGDGSQDDKETESNSESNTSLKVNSSGVAVVSSAQVSSESDLNIFSANVSAKDKEVAKVDINSGKDGESEVKVVYRNKGKFLGFIPVTIKSTTVVKVKADAEVEVRSKLSWWSFLVANENYTRADIESRIKNNTTVKANARVSASAQAKAQIAEAVIAEVVANANTQVSVNK